ncbi:hypothetical protein MHYP_G00268300 [Metynnis hypsauchen]
MTALAALRKSQGPFRRDFSQQTKDKALSPPLGTASLAGKIRARCRLIMRLCSHVSSAWLHLCYTVNENPHSSTV